MQCGVLTSSQQNSTDNHEVQLATLYNEVPVSFSPLPGSSLMYASFYPTKSLQYMMVRLFCLCKCITMSKNDEDYRQYSSLKSMISIHYNSHCFYHQSIKSYNAF
ncbi:hypothetical protein BDB01DRAFT_840167 [Pilobolus umbonatus]|nr:hypothetical protein BDB01DRAFT_840167 [Pilobolus umbonatus]